MPGHEPSLVSASLWQTPQACTLMRTCPAPGVGISRSTSWKSAPALAPCASFRGAAAICVVAKKPPSHFQTLSKNPYYSWRGGGTLLAARLCLHYGSTQHKIDNRSANPSCPELGLFDPL